MDKSYVSILLNGFINYELTSKFNIPNEIIDLLETFFIMDLKSHIIGKGFSIQNPSEIIVHNNQCICNISHGIGKIFYVTKRFHKNENKQKKSFLSLTNMDNDKKFIIYKNSKLIKMESNKALNHDNILIMHTNNERSKYVSKIIISDLDIAVLSQGIY